MKRLQSLMQEAKSQASPSNSDSRALSDLARVSHDYERQLRDMEEQRQKDEERHADRVQR